MSPKTIKLEKKIPEYEWKWYGTAGHFVRGQCYCFHLCTEIGDLVVSTVGDYTYPRPGKGFEGKTSVFKMQGHCEDESCGCRQPVISGAEVFSAEYNDIETARQGHMEVCDLVSRGAITEKGLIDDV